MKPITVQTTINKPIEDVFAFTIDPANTPKWVDSIAIEQTNEWPVKQGTIYRSQNQAGAWSQWELTTLEPNKSFTLSKPDGSRIDYVFTALDPNATQLEYTWVNEIELGKPFLENLLTKLKTVIEAS